MIVLYKCLLFTFEEHMNFTNVLKVGDSIAYPHELSRLDRPDLSVQKSHIQSLASDWSVIYSIGPRVTCSFSENNYYSVVYHFMLIMSALATI